MLRMIAVYTRNPWIERLMHGAVYGVIVLMPFSILYPLAEPLSSGAIELYVTPGLELADIPTCILLLLVGVDCWLARRTGVARPGPFSGLLLLLAALGFAAALTALAPLLAVYTAARWLLAAGTLWAIVQTRTPPQRIAYVLGISLCFHAAAALLQGWYGEPLGLPAELTLHPGAPAAAVIHLGERVWLRGYGLTFHPNVLGGYFAVALILLLPLLASRWARALWSVLLLGLAATFSRSAALALLLMAPPVVWWLWRTNPAARVGLRRAVVGSGCAAVLAVVILWKPITVRLDPLITSLGMIDSDPVLPELHSLLGRQQMNQMAAEIVARHPCVGIGAGNFPIAMEAAATDLSPQYVHNVPLLLGAEVGVGGMLIWLALTAWATVVAVRAPDRWKTAAAAAWWALLIIGMFDCYPWSLNAGRLLTVTVLALLEASRFAGREGAPSPQR